MTDARTTQIAAEEWAVATPNAQLTQVVLEEWASLATGAGQALLSQIAIEEWARVVSAQTAIPSVSVIT